jgi:hypothetical protein
MFQLSLAMKGVADAVQDGCVGESQKYNIKKAQLKLCGISLHFWKCHEHLPGWDRIIVCDGAVEFYWRLYWILEN